MFARKQRVVTTLAILLPWAVAGAAYASSPDDRWPPPHMTNPNGESAVVADDEPRGDVTELGATFELPLRVEAGKVSGPDPRGNLTVEVLLRRLGSFPKATTLFVHVERRQDQGEPPKDREDFFNADHQVVGGSFYLAETPQGKLVRDVFGVHLDRAASGTWDVWVAVGDVSGRKGRKRVVDPGHATLSNDRVRVGTFVVP